ncbi:MAG: methionine adenosyltransferase [Armatimonadetes bacterium]|nr:methionine adenosyltransferase [Armatimonadota bacterium]
MNYPRIYTSESVSEGHPDKVADQISDALLDGFLQQDLDLSVPDDRRCRVAIETMLAHGVAVVSGEVTSMGYVNVQEIVRETIKSIGYANTEVGFDGENCGVLVAIQPQSADIAMGVDTGGAGDQGMMFGMATNETPELMPLTISIAHAIMKQSVAMRRSNPELGFRPDAKSQVSVIYEGNKPKRIETIVVSQQHDDMPQDEVRQRIEKYLVQPVLEQYKGYVDGPINYHFNPTGRFVKGGPAGDTGLTGRKIIVDTYGGMCPHGGGAFSGKDPTKVDRSAAYMARHVAKCIVAAELADKAQVALAYAIGKAEPVSVNVETFGTEKIDPQEISRRVQEAFDMTPRGILKHLSLRDCRAICYRDSARNGHFGNGVFPWEKTDDAAKLK